VYLQDRLAPIEVGCVYDDLTIKTTGAEQGPVENLGTVGCGQDITPVLGSKPSIST
jgi:hypothetical protein